MVVDWSNWQRIMPNLLNVENIFGVNANNLPVDVIMMATKEVIYRKKQAN